MTDFEAGRALQVEKAANHTREITTEQEKLAQSPRMMGGDAFAHSAPGATEILRELAALVSLKQALQSPSPTWQADVELTDNINTVRTLLPEDDPAKSKDFRRGAGGFCLLLAGSQITPSVNPRESNNGEVDIEWCIQQVHPSKRVRVCTVCPIQGICGSSRVPKVKN